jgi:putative PEP-CTERM system TPR-repeat lipoprotein
VAALPEVPEVVDALGRAQSAAGDQQQAKSTFGKLGVLLPRSPLPHLRMATVLSATGDTAGAQQSLRRALDLQPDLLAAQRALADIALKERRPADALGIARTVQKQRPTDAVGYLMEGNAQAIARQWDAAAAAYRNGAQRAPSSELSIKLHTVLMASGKTGEADRLAADWQKAHPQDGAFVLYLGDRALATQQWAAAQRHYEHAVELNPGNALALNNLAWVAGRLGRADAVSLAERANQAAPNQPAYLDTLAVLLSERNEHARAIRVQQQAVALDPASPVYKLNLARIHLKAGDKAAARALLDELAALGGRFVRQAEVKQLREGL